MASPSNPSPQPSVPGTPRVSVILSTVPSEEVADQIARALVEEHQAACVQILPNVKSIYRWQGKVSEDQEWLLVIKTRHDRVDATIAAVKALHPYETPEIIAIPVETGFEDYLRWVEENVK